MAAFFYRFTGFDKIRRGTEEFPAKIGGNGQQALSSNG